jgi:uncharacterized protein
MRPSLFGIMLLLAGCASSGAPQVPVASLKELRQTGVVVQQWDASCAAAALATLLTYQHDHPVPERTIVEAMLRKTDPLRVRVRGGFSLLDLKRYADTRGLRGIGYTKLAVTDLVKFAPAIVPVNLTGFPHFVVFRGMVGDEVLLADPAFGNRTMHVDRFSASWIQQIGFIVARSDGSPAPPGRLAVRLDDVARVPDLAVRDAYRR